MLAEALPMSRPLDAAAVAAVKLRQDSTGGPLR